MAIKLIVGLANPGREYQNNRHNVGGWLLEQLAARESAILKSENKFHGLVSKVMIANNPVYLLEPTTYMNDSGRAVLAIAHFYKILPEEIVIAHDELDLEPGIVRFKIGGGHGGHNGLRSIMSSLGTRDFYRIRIGIGHPGSKDKVTPYVLGDPGKHDRELIEKSIDEALSCVDDIVVGEFEKVMRYLHN